MSFGGTKEDDRRAGSSGAGRLGPRDDIGPWRAAIRNLHRDRETSPASDPWAGSRVIEADAVGHTLMLHGFVEELRDYLADTELDTLLDITGPNG